MYNLLLKTCSVIMKNTRVFLHAQHAAQEHTTVIIKSPDTDVAVIAVSLTHIIDITKFGADIAEGFSGFYRNTYRTTAGETREQCVGTVPSDGFEPFTFQTQVQHIALSNMPVVSVITSHISWHLSSVSIYAAPEKWTQTHYALDVAVKMLGFYEKYFNICYPLPKQDLIAIPDFQSGAMENWGLTTYRETSLLYDPLTSSLHDKLWTGFENGASTTSCVIAIFTLMKIPRNLLFRDAW
uniref:Endoplasmic reticulum aminopeptidase 2 n=1 Tax=Cynoglossus semilaevis TaxID=244447 RepID=A0A3P8VTH4_CYNSE